MEERPGHCSALVFQLERDHCYDRDGTEGYAVEKARERFATLRYSVVDVIWRRMWPKGGS